MNDRKLGYGVILFLILFIAGSTVYVAIQGLEPAYHSIIIFESSNSLSFLKSQDQVRIRGVEAGKIRKIVLKNDKALVEIETRCPLKLHKGYKIIAEAKGFMGDRYIEVNPGDMQAPAVSSKQPLIGVFPMGPTEAIAYTADLKTKVHSLIKITEGLKCPSPGKKRLDVRLAEMAEAIDSMSITLKNVLCQANSFIVKNADTMAAIMEKTKEFSAILGKKTPTVLLNVENSIVKTRRLLNAADSLSVSCSFLLDRMKTLESGVLRNDINRLRQQIVTLGDFITELQENGLRLHIKL
jgi:phospholipid/cholesterol/gamma-HCH transport system substrate-binding protein